MSKINFAFVIWALIGISTAHAATGKEFHSIEGNDKGCKLAKFANSKWTVSNEHDLDGQAITNITVSKANADFSNFKYQGNWYASKTECLKDSDSAASEAPAAPGAMPKYFIDLKVEKFLMMGSNTGAAVKTVTTTSPATVETFQAYQSGIGIDGRVGYYWKNNKYFILDLDDFTASQNVTTTGAYVGTPSVSDAIFTVDVGMQMPFVKPIFGLKPYVAGMLGYTKMTGSITGTVNSGNLTIGYSASGINVKLEGGLVKEFTPDWSALFSLGYTYVSLSPKVDVSNSPLFPLASTMDARGYSHLNLGLGVRYSF